MKKVTLLLLVVSIIVSCNSKKKSGNTYSLQMSDTVVKIPVDNLVYPQSYRIQFFEDKNAVRYLAYMNKDRNEILFFKFDSLKLTKRIEIQKEGPETVGNLSGFFVKGLDSIYVNANAKQILFLVNGNGKILKEYDYSAVNDSASFPAMDTHSLTPCPIISIGNSLFLARVPAGSWGALTKEQMAKFNLCLTLKPEDGGTHLFPITYPEEMHELHSITYSRTVENNTFVYSFGKSKYLYLTRDNITWERVEAKSKYVNKIVPLAKNPDMAEYLRYVCSSPEYTMILHDKYRDLYYRIVYPGVKVKKEDNLQKISRMPPLVSVLILNNRFNVVGETLLPKDIFNTREIFVAKEGLYISENNPDNPDYNEDFLSYRLLKIEKYD